MKWSSDHPWIKPLLDSEGRLRLPLVHFLSTDRREGAREDSAGVKPEILAKLNRATDEVVASGVHQPHTGSATARAPVAWAITVRVGYLSSKAKLLTEYGQLWVWIGLATDSEGFWSPTHRDDWESMGGWGLPYIWDALGDFLLLTPEAEVGS